MTRKRSGSLFCEGCGLTQRLCLCETLPCVAVPARIVLLQHFRETRFSTNTGRLLLRMIPEAEHRLFGVWGESVEAASLGGPDEEILIVFPRDDAEVLDPRGGAGDGERRRTFVLLDGKWAQCSRMSRRLVPGGNVRYVKLPPGPPSEFRVRKPRDPASLCTLEAGIRLARILAGEAPARAMETFFHDWQERMLVVMGRTSLVALGLRPPVRRRTPRRPGSRPPDPP